MTFAIHTLGCKVNQCDGEKLSGELVRLGFFARDFDEKADVYIVNTCTVTHTSDKKSRQFIGKAKRRNPDALVAVCGCMVQKEAFQHDFADFLFDARKPLDFLQKLANRTGVSVEELPSSSGHLTKTPLDGDSVQFSNKSAKRTRSFLKIQDGCRQYCSYCIVPYVRGGSVSRPKGEILSEVANLVADGVNEIVLTGINISAYRNEVDFYSLLKKILETAKQTRVRLSSTEPMAVNESFLDVVRGHDNLCPHFHLPLQSGSDKILKNMNRKYSADEYKMAVKYIRDVVPNAAVTTDVMVGFPGEDESDFLCTYSLTLAVGFSDMHVFEYSKREGTPAAGFPMQVENSIKKLRSKKIRDLAKKLKIAYMEQQLNKVLQVLFEKETDAGVYEGFSKEYVQVVAKSGEPLKNTMRNVRVTDIWNERLIGEIVLR